ncbi:hypothetical protein N657DRAFT_637382 [Parathielavia appendiculata]|uniref:Uncharacterized protein n=1 Tax=Parathielavia appendiculata TaxID=2587402 RepID=A0AAN6TSG1_9PEZI|nr:hypothetical protein N657DRAFT_637382 [Parathielavia appendiculata]
MLLKELVAELKTLNENLGQFRHFKNLSDQLPRLQSLLDAVPPQQPLQQHTRPQDGVGHETQDGKEISQAGKSGEPAQEMPQQQLPQECEVNQDEAEMPDDGVGQHMEQTSEVGESGEPAQDSLQQQPPQEHEVNQDEAEAISGTRERSALDRPREGPLSRHSANFKTETSEADKSNASARTDPPRQGAFEMLDLFPSAAFLRDIRQCLEEAVGPCRCKEPPIFIGKTRLWLTSNDEPDPRKEVYHAFRDVVLVIPASLAAASGLMEITLHPAVDSATPRGPGRGPGQLEGYVACRNFIKISWPRHPVESNDLTPRRLIARNDIRPASSTLSSLVSSAPERGDFWFFIGASHDCIRKVQFYAGSSLHESLLTVPCLVYADWMRKVPRVISRTWIAVNAIQIWRGLEDQKMCK